MTDLLLKLLRLLVIFLRNAVGCFNHPYITYRKMAAEKKVDFSQTIYLFIGVIGYFAFAQLVRIGMHNPYLLTLKFNLLLISGGIGLIGMISLFYFLGRLVGGAVSFKALFLLWSYSLLPTLVWFFTTSIMYLILPPPRTISILGKLYSVLFISFSIGILIWKLILYYLTLRFGAKLDLWRIMFVSAVLLPIVAVYSLTMYRLGIFRIPFL